MKKTVKSLIIAASVAAIAGIGAVSFAAWSGTGYNEVSTGGALGDVEFVGYNAATATNWTGTLVPMDQPSNTIKGDGVTVVSITLPEVKAVNGQKVTITASLADYTATEGTGIKNDLYALYYSAAPTDAPDADTIKSTGKKVEAPVEGTAGAELKSYSATTTETGVIYFALDSNDYAAHDKTYTITVTLSDPA